MMTAKEFGDLLGIIEKSSPAEGSERFEKLAVELRNYLAESFGAKDHEISLIIVDSRKFANFVLPKPIAKTGLPLRNSKVTRKVYDENQPLLSNDMTDVERNPLFEKMKDTKEEKVLPIQKCMVLPLKDIEKSIGVVWVNRRAESLEAAGPDFTNKDLEWAAQVLRVAGPYLNRARPKELK